jgi:hypothetical protein
MKRLVASLMAVSMTLLSFTAQAQQTPNLPEVQTQLATQKADLAEFQKELRKATFARRGWITIMVATGVLSFIAALPGVFATYGGIDNMSHGAPFLGHSESGGAMFLPVIIVGTATSVGAGYGAYKSFRKVQLRAADIKILEGKIQDKLADIEKAEQLAKALN